MTAQPVSSASDRPTPRSVGPMPGGVWWVPMDDALLLLPVSKRTLWAHKAEGRLPHRVIRGRVFMAWPQDFEAYLEAAYRGPTQTAA